MEEASRIGQLSAIAIARICHEVNRAYCVAIGDDSQVSWEDAPVWQRDSAMQGVEMALKAYAEDEYIDPETQHNGWMTAKLRGGWRYGSQKDADAKVHSCLLPYSELPKEQKVKDNLFAAIVGGFAPETPTD